MTDDRIRGLDSLNPPPPVPYDGPMHDIDGTPLPAARVDAGTPTPDTAFDLLAEARKHAEMPPDTPFEGRLQRYISALIAEIERLRALDAQRVADCERLMEVAERLRAQRQAALDLCDGWTRMGVLAAPISMLRAALGAGE